MKPGQSVPKPYVLSAATSPRGAKSKYAIEQGSCFDSRPLQSPEHLTSRDGSFDAKDRSPGADDDSLSAASRGASRRSGPPPACAARHEDRRSQTRHRGIGRIKRQAQPRHSLPIGAPAGGRSNHRRAPLLAAAKGATGTLPAAAKGATGTLPAVAPANRAPGSPPAVVATPAR